MADNAKDFHAMADPIFTQANATACRVPLTDLFDTIRCCQCTRALLVVCAGIVAAHMLVLIVVLGCSATCAYGEKAFVARPVVGGVYAKMLAPGAYPF